MYLSSYTLYSIDWRHIKIKIDVIYYIKDCITYLFAITYTRTDYVDEWQIRLHTAYIWKLSVWRYFVKLMIIKILPLLKCGVYLHNSLTWNWFKLSPWCPIKIAKEPHEIKFITWHCTKMSLNIFNIKIGSSAIMDTNQHWLRCFCENENNKVEGNKMTVIKLYYCYHPTLWFHAIVSSNIYNDFCIISYQTQTKKMTDM